MYNNVSINGVPKFPLDLNLLANNKNNNLAAEMFGFVVVVE